MEEGYIIIEVFNTRKNGILTFVNPEGNLTIDLQEAAVFPEIDSFDVYQDNFRAVSVKELMDNTRRELVISHDLEGNQQFFRKHHLITTE